MSNTPDAEPYDVLLVEDDVVQAEEMAGYLARTGLTVRTAHNGASALRRAASFPPRVALLDFNLPDMTGVELADQLRAFLPEATIMMMSGRIEGLSEQTLATGSITAFLNKPIPLAALRQAVLKIVRSGARPPRPSGWLSAGLGGTRNG